MKILMMRPSYRPELSGGTHLAIDLVQDFVKAGHQVVLITAVSDKLSGNIDETQDECKVYRIFSKYNKKDPMSRILRYIDTTKRMAQTAKKIDGVDLIMTHSMPPLLGIVGAKIAKKKKIPSLYWEQDIVSESLISTEMFGKTGIKQSVLYRIAKAIEMRTEKKSTHIITISKQFKKMHIDRGVDAKKIDVVYNWIDTNQIYPVKRKDNPLFDELIIPKDKFIVTYCGNLGVPQNVEIMIDAAEQLQDEKKVFFLIIGGGSREKYVKKYIQQKKLKNLKLLPLQPLEKSQYVYSIGDIGLVIGRKGTSKNGFPSKTWSIMAAGQAMISCFDRESELSKFVEKGRCGLAIEPDSSEELVKAIKKIYSEKNNNYGKNARKYVMDNFSREKSTKQIINIAESLARKDDK